MRRVNMIKLASPRSLLAMLVRLCALVLWLASPFVSAQLLPGDQPPKTEFKDAMNVNLRSGMLQYPGRVYSIGPAGNPALAMNWFALNGESQVRTPLGGATYKVLECYYTSPYGCVYLNTHKYFKLGSRVEYDRALIAQGAFIPNYTPGPTVPTTDDPITEPDGTVWTFTPVPHDGNYTLGGNSLAVMSSLLKSVRYPDGEQLTFTYNGNRTLLSIVSNLGYMLHLDYDGSGGWSTATMINLRYDWCDPNAVRCDGLTNSWPVVRVAKSAGKTYGTDPMGRVTTFGSSGNDGTGVDYYFSSPGGRSLQFRYAIVGTVMNCGLTIARPVNANTRVSTAAGTWNYSYTVPTDCKQEPRPLTVTSTNPKGETLKMGGQAQTTTDGLGRVTQYVWNFLPSKTTAQSEPFKPASITRPEGDRVDYTYDSRWNLIKTEVKAKPGSSLASVVTSATYGTCASASDFKVCNKPQTTTDALGNVTSYTYEPNTGLLATQTLPAVPSPAGSVQPQTRNTYAAMYARYRQLPSGNIPARRRRSTSSHAHRPA
jgi:hypothetical protein